MKKIIACAIVLMASACATPKVTKKHDVFAGGEVTSLRQNQLNTPGFGDIYFDLESVASSNGKKLQVIGVVDYEAPGDANIKIDKTKDFVIITDNKRIALKPVKDSYDYHKSMGLASPMHVQSMKYEITEEALKIIASSKRVSMKIFAHPHVGGGFEGTFDKRNFDKLNEFLRSL